MNTKRIMFCLLSGAIIHASESEKPKTQDISGLSIGVPDGGKRLADLAKEAKAVAEQRNDTEDPENPYIFAKKLNNGAFTLDARISKVISSRIIELDIRQRNLALDKVKNMLKNANAGEALFRLKDND